MRPAQSGEREALDIQTAERAGEFERAPQISKRPLGAAGVAVWNADGRERENFAGPVPDLQPQFQRTIEAFQSLLSLIRQHVRDAYAVDRDGLTAQIVQRLICRERLPEILAGLFILADVKI